MTGADADCDIAEEYAEHNLERIKKSEHCGMSGTRALTMMLRQKSG